MQQSAAGGEDNGQHVPRGWEAA